MACSLPMAVPGDLRDRTIDAPDLCARAARGEREAILAIYEAHSAHVLAFARRLIADDALAEDLVHEVFLVLPQALGRFRGEGSLRSYLVGIAAGRAHRQIRTAARRRAMEARLAREPLPSPGTPDAHAERIELAALLSRALDTLPVDQRVAFVLCEVEERSSTEVGAMLGRSDATIRARVLHAKKKLRDALAALAPREGGAR